MSEIKGVWSVLKEIKDELKDFDDKWEQHIQDAASDRQRLSTIGTQVDHIEKLLTRGNGQKSVMVRLETLHHDVEQLKEDHKELKEASGIHDITPETVKEADAKAREKKWAALKHIAIAFGVALPGILALLGVGG